MIARLEHPASFESLRKEWNELLEASASNCLFLTWEWLYTWWKHLSEGRELFLITLRSGGELVAIAPLAVRPPSLTRLLPYRSLEFLGTGSVGSDYLDLLIRRGREQETLQALADYLADGKLMLTLDQLNRSSCLATELAAQLRQRGWSASEAKTNICPFMNISGHSWESYLAAFGRKHRYNFQRELKNLAKTFNVRFEQVRTEEQRREALGLLMSLHNMRWRERGGSNAFHTPGLVSFHEELSRLACERGWLRLFILWLDGKPAASLYGFRYHRAFYFYQLGFDPTYRKHGVGKVTIGLTIKSAIEERVEEYDLLHGDEPYKSYWAREARELGRLELYPPHLRGLLYRKTMGFSRTARKMARRLLPQRVLAG